MCSSRENIMWMLWILLLALSGLYIKVSTSYLQCILNGQRAFCAGQRHYRVPVLPPNITHLFLERNYISEIDSSSFTDLRELQQLDLGWQKVNLVIRNNSFLNQTKLIGLVLGSNVGLKLEIGAFSGLLNLQYLYLDYCNLSESVLSESYLEQLLSLEMLDLFGNRIARLRPGQFFSRLTKFTQLNLKMNQIEKLCEDDLASFRGKYFMHFNLQNNKLFKTLDMQSCGNPFRGMAFNILDLSNNGLNVSKTRQFFKAIEGTRIAHFIYSGQMGRDFSFDNLPDPNESTFEGLRNSGVGIFDLSQNRIFTLQRAVFSPLKDAIIIDISQNKINQIKRNAFDGLQNHLRMLNLSSNLLGEIEFHTFDFLTQLRVLDLSYNHIGVFGHSAFRGLTKLRALFLKGNSLKVLGFPKSLPNLEQLHLDDNRLKDLYNIELLGRNSTYVDVSDNKLTNLEIVYILLNQFRNLQYLFFGGNSIKWCNLNSDFTIPRNNSLVVLDLHDSSLGIVWERGNCLDLFDNLSNLVGLNISSNSITNLPWGIFRGLKLTQEIDLSSNALTYLRTDVFPTSLKILHLSNNFLTVPDPSTFYSLAFLSLSGNWFYCDCSLEPFLEWLNTTVTLLSSVEEYRCKFPATLHHLPLLDYFNTVEPCEKDDEQVVRHLKLALFIFSALLIASIVVSGVVYTRLRGPIFIIYKKVVGRVLAGPEQPFPVDEMQYDAFVCFSNNDYDWVEAALLKKLDNQFAEENMFRCCFEARDFLPGEDHLSNIRDAIWGSRKTLCIISKEFLKDGWCLEAFTLAQGRMLEELTNVLVMLVVGKVAHYQLMKCNAIRAFVRKREYLTWPEDPQDLDWFYERLITQLLKHTKVKKFEENQPEPVEHPVEPQAEEEIQLEDIREIAE